MCKKSIYLISFVLLLSMAGNALADLVVHWRLDEGSGTTAYDSSGNGYDGEFVGTPEWVQGHNSPGALHFTAEGQIVLYSFDAAVEWPAGTVAVWVKADTVGQGNWNGVFSSHVPNSAGFQMDTDDGDPGNYRFQPGGIIFGTVTTDWIHLAVAWDSTSANVYYNGSLASSGTVTATNTTFNQFAMGINRNAANTLMGLFDDLRIYDHALSEIEILGAMAGQPWPYAFGPNPADGALHEDTWINLAWIPGDLAVSHDVYLGESFDDVNSGAEGTFQGNQAGTALIVGFPGFHYPDGLVPGTTYYWRVDEVNDTEPNSPWKGDVWSFMVPPKTAYDPVPADGVKFIDPNVQLSWMPGFGTRLHHVYFGDNFDDVNIAAGALPQTDATYTPGTLELDKVYFWRIDEFEGVETHKGDVWSFKTKPFIPITDPNFVGWWTLEEGIGTVALDWSGHGHDATFRGNPQWVDGYDGGALNFSGNNQSAVYSFSEETWSAYTVALWAKADVLGQGQYKSVFSSHIPNDFGFQLDVDGTDPGNYRYNGVNVGTAFFGTVTTNWVHIAATSNGVSTTLYFNGNLVAGIGAADAVFNKFGIGINRLEDNWFDGIIDDVRVYNRELTQEEIQYAMRGDPLLSWDAGPANGSVPNLRDARSLSWLAGDNASGHDVYFGTDKDAVADADESDTTGIYRGRQGSTSYNTAQDVEWGKGPYYWRIDEYNTDQTISKGRIWTFTVADFIGIDDFEDYNTGDNQIWYEWKDGLGYGTLGTEPYYAGNGTGSAVGDETTNSYTEETIVHGGSKSMPLAYDNSVFRYSEVEMTLSYPRDWTEEGVGVLSLWFYGDAANAAEPMYVALNGSAVVSHDNPNAVLIDEWNQWNIDLQEFADQGVNLTNVNTIAIGLGNKKNPVAGGSGKIYIDDIQLRRPLQEPEPEPAP